MAPATGSRRSLGIVLLLLAWLSGTAALNLGLLRQATGDVAIPFFLAACGLWLTAFQILRVQTLAFKFVPLALILLWVFSLGLAALAQGSDIYKTPFFVVSSSATLVLLVFFGISFKSNPRGQTTSGEGDN